MASNEDELADLNVMRRELKRCGLLQRAIYILEDVGFRNISSLQDLDEASLDSIQNLNLAERLTLKKLIRNEWRGLRVPTEKREPSLNVETRRFGEHDEVFGESTSRQSTLHDWPHSKSKSRDSGKEEDVFAESTSTRKSTLHDTEDVNAEQERKGNDVRDLNKQSKKNESMEEFSDVTKQEASSSQSVSFDDSEDRQRKLKEDLQTAEKESVLTIQMGLAKTYLMQGNYQKAEETLLKLDERSKSPRYRILFGGNLTTRLQAFSALHNKIDDSVTDFLVLNKIAMEAFKELSLGYKELLDELNLPSSIDPLTAWMEQLREILKLDDNLKYGSSEWTQIITKTTHLTDFFSRSSDDAMQIVNKSVIMMILQTVSHIWSVRNTLCSWDFLGLLRIASYALPLSECELISSVYFGQIRLRAYDMMVLSLGCTISNDGLSAVQFKPEFDQLNQRLEKIYAKCLDSKTAEERTEADQTQLNRYIREVKCAYRKETNIDSTSEKKFRKRKSLHNIASQIVQYFHSKRYASMRRSMEEAEEELQQVDFKLSIACKFSSTYSEIADFHDSADSENDVNKLQMKFCEMLQKLGKDCSSTLMTKMKKFSSKGLENWIECVLECDDLVLGSEQWAKLLKRSKEAVSDILPGVDEDGRCVLSLYVHLAVVLIRRVWTTHNHLDPSNQERLLKLASINVQLIHSDLFTSKWFCKLKYQVYEMKLLSLAACIGKGVITAYSEYDENRKELHRYRDECKALSISVEDANDRQQLKRFHKVVESRRAGKKTSGDHGINKGDNVIGKGHEVTKIVSAAIYQYHSKNFDKMVTSLSDAIRVEQSCDILLAFAGNLSYTFNYCVDYSNTIPEKEGLMVVETATHRQLLVLAEDNNEMMIHIGQDSNTDFRILMDMLFQCLDLSPKTKAWNNLMNQSRRCIQYFESLPEAGQVLSKAHILLFVTILHNFVAVRNRLFPSEHNRLLPYIQVCIPFCESHLVKSDEWADMKASVYGTIVSTSSSAMGMNQILHYESFHTYGKRFLRLKNKVKKHSHFQEEQVLRSINDVLDLQNTLLQRMCFALAVLYYEAECYKGMNYFLSELDKFDGTDTWRLRMITRISSGLDQYLMYYNKISKEKNETLLDNCWNVLKCIADIHKKSMRRFGRTSNIIRIWVDTLFQVKNGKPTAEHVEYGSNDWSTLMEISEEVATYINNFGDGGRGISQSYIHFFCDFNNKFMAAWSVRHGNENVRDLRLLLSSIKLFEALDTSLFSAKLKKTVYNLAALNLSAISKIWQNQDFTQMIEECVRQVEVCQNILSESTYNQHKAFPDWFSYQDDSKDELSDEEAEVSVDKEENEEVNQPTTIKSKKTNLTFIIGDRNLLISDSQVNIHNHFPDRHQTQVTTKEIA